MGTLYRRAKSSCWFANYVDADGNRQRRSTGCARKRDAQAVLAKWETDQRLVEAGLRDSSTSDIHAHLESQIREYQAHLSVAGKSADHINRTCQLIRKTADYAHWRKLADVRAKGIQEYASRLKSYGRSPRTIHSMITANRSFCRWCVRVGKLKSDPTASIEKPSLIEDRRIERRALQPAEWKWVSKHLAEATTKNGQDGPERELMYLTALETGLRSGELRGLCVSDLKLDVSCPHVLAKATTTKNSKVAKQYISDGLAARLAQHVDLKLPAAAVFNVAARTEMARTLRADVSAAREMWLGESRRTEKQRDSDFLRSPDSQGHVIDFHALRHTCGAWLVQAGVTVQEVKNIMRHSTIVLTMDAYGHLMPDAQSARRNTISEVVNAS